MTITENTIKAAQDTGAKRVWLVVIPGETTHYVVYDNADEAVRYVTDRGVKEGFIIDMVMGQPYA